jgi:hypothetical protein
MLKQKRRTITSVRKHQTRLLLHSHRNSFYDASGGSIAACVILLLLA